MRFGFLAGLAQTPTGSDAAHKFAVASIKPCRDESASGFAGVADAELGRLLLILAEFESTACP